MEDIFRTFFIIFVLKNFWEWDCERNAHFAAPTLPHFVSQVKTDSSKVLIQTFRLIPPFSCVGTLR